MGWMKSNASCNIHTRKIKGRAFCWYETAQATQNRPPLLGAILVTGRGHECSRRLGFRTPPFLDTPWPRSRRNEICSGGNNAPPLHSAEVGSFFARPSAREASSDEILGEEPEQQFEVRRVISKKPASEVSWE